MDIYNHWRTKVGDPAGRASYASFKRRCAAFLADVLLVYMVAGLIVIVSGPVAPESIRVVVLIATISSLGYFTIFSICGQSFGSRLFGIRVTLVTGTRLTLRKAFVRACFLAAIVGWPRSTILPLGLFITTLILIRREPFRNRRQTIWDAITGSVVVSCFGADSAKNPDEPVQGETE